MSHEAYLRSIGLSEFADGESDASEQDSANAREDAGEQSSPSPPSASSREDADEQSSSSPRSHAHEDAAERGSALVARPPHATVDAETVAERYEYPVPELGEDGTCGVGLADEPYNLAPICGLEYDREQLRDHPNTARLVALHETVENLSAETGADWLGVYRRATSPAGEDVLVKEAYVGDHSRAEFPLTESFAERSNNSTVGRTGEAVLVNSVEDYDGPYYECDDRVESEFCCPILSDGDVVGIVDAEAHEPEFFDAARALAIVGACAELGDSRLLTPPRVDT